MAKSIMFIYKFIDYSTNAQLQIHITLYSNGCSNHLIPPKKYKNRYFHKKLLTNKSNFQRKCYNNYVFYSHMYGNHLKVLKIQISIFI